MDEFDTLPSSIQRRIDSVFTQILSSASDTHKPPRKRRKLNTLSESSAGGFLIEASDEEQDEHLDDTIPFSFIPSALQALDLPPDDDEVLQVFRNAANGWRNAIQDYSSPSFSNEGGIVSRKDWRAVCSVLITSGGEEEAEDQPSSRQNVIVGGFLLEDEDGPNEPMRINSSDVEDMSEGDNYDAYEASPLSPLEDEYEREDSDDSDEYQEQPKNSKGKGKDKGRPLKGKAREVSPEPGTPTPRQRRAALDAFVLFFESPPESESELLKKRLTFKDIHRVADLLKQKLKVDEVQEMVSLFSTSPDKTMSFDDFVQMMLMAKLV